MPIIPKPAIVLLLTYLLLSQTGVPGCAGELGLFEGHGDVGAVKHEGSVSYDRESQTYVISGAGANMWFGEDEFHCAWKRMKGDFILSAQAEFIGEGVDPHRKMGWIIRPDLRTDSPYVDVALHGDGLTSMQYRRTTGGDTDQVQSGSGAC